MNSEHRFVVFRVDRDIVAFAREYRRLYEQATGQTLSIPQAAINAAILFEGSGDAICTNDNMGKAGC